MQTLDELLIDLEKLITSHVLDRELVLYAPNRDILIHIPPIMKNDYSGVERYALEGKSYEIGLLYLLLKKEKKNSTAIARKFLLYFAQSESFKGKRMSANDQAAQKLFSNIAYSFTIANKIDGLMK